MPDPNVGRFILGSKYVYFKCKKPVVLSGVTEKCFAQYVERHSYRALKKIPPTTTDCFAPKLKTHEFWVKHSADKNDT